MHNIVEENIEANYPCKNSYQIHEDFTKHLKKEDFDKKEFPFCKKMLLFKKQENCAVESPSNSKKVDSVNRTTTNNAIRKEVNVIEGEVSVKKQNDVLIQNLKKYHTIFLQHDQEDRESSNEGKPEFGSTKLVQLIFKHKEQLNLKKVAKMYHEKMKEKDKFEKKTIEEKLKKQTNLIKKRDFYNFNSIHTLKHFLDNKKILEKTLCNKKISQSTFFLPKSKQSQKKHNISNTNSCVRFGNLNSNRIGSLQSTEQNIENIEEKIEENFEKAQNVN